MERLLHYYHSKSDTEKEQSLIQVYSKCVFRLCETIEPLAANWHLEELAILFHSHGMRVEYTKVCRLLWASRQLVVDSMQRISTPLNLKQEELDHFIASIICDSLEESCHNLADKFLPKLEELEEDFNNLPPLMKLLKSSTTDGLTRSITKGALEGSDEKLLEVMNSLLQFDNFLLERCLMFLYERFTGEVFIDWLYTLPAFEIDRKPILQNAIQHYLDGDWMTVVHLLIPQIEHLMRQLLWKLGGCPSKPDKDRRGIFREKDLGEVMRDPIIEGFLKEDVTRYIRFILVDERGWNMRNEVSHGLNPLGYFRRHKADRLLHILFLLTLLKVDETSKISEGS